jgi:hypothetical protein
MLTNGNRRAGNAAARSVGNLSDADNNRPSPPTQADPAAEIFAEVCRVRAELFALGTIDLQRAVDGAQFAAVACGLVATMGQDRVQEHIASVFAPLRADDDFCDANIFHDDPDDHDDDRDRDHVPAATLHAAEYLISQNDPERLRAWLEGRGPREVAAIQEHIQAKRRKGAA